MSAICQLLSWSVVGSSSCPSLACPVEMGTILGYVGPGAGLSMMGALFAVVCVVSLALLGPILYPIRLFRSWRRRQRERRAILALATAYDLAQTTPSSVELTTPRPAIADPDRVACSAPHEPRSVA